MAIYDDNFQGYAIGAQVPFGSWILDTSAITNVIISGHAPTGMTQAYRLFGNVVLDPTVPGYRSSFTVFVAIFKDQKGEILAFANGPNLTGHIFEIMAIKVEADSTLSVTGPLAEILGNSLDDWFDFNAVNFLQVNVQLSDVLVSGINHINIHCQIALNGKQVISFNTTTGAAVTDLKNGTSEVNKFQLVAAEAFYSAYTLDTLQAINAYPHLGTPSALAFQAVAEVDALPDNAKLEVIQAVAEIDVLAPNKWYISES